MCCEFAITHLICIMPVQTVKRQFPFFCLRFREPSAACQQNLTTGLLWVHVTAITPTTIPIAVFIFAVSPATGLSILRIPGMLSPFQNMICTLRENEICIQQKAVSLQKFGCTSSFLEAYLKRNDGWL